MVKTMGMDHGRKQSIHALEAINFFLAGVRTGLAPFLAAYMAGSGGEPGRVGIANFREAMSAQICYPFTVGDTRFIGMNAFDVPEPSSFTVSEEQLRWAEDELKLATQRGQTKILPLHCYPTNLMVGGGEVSRLVQDYDVRLIDTGHNHYNEIANNGRTLYSATRSTGQIEEGPVGYSVTNIDGNVVSRRFIELGKLPVAAITSPNDERFLTKSSEIAPETLQVRAKFWGEVEPVEANAHLDGQTNRLKRVGESHV